MLIKSLELNVDEITIAKTHKLAVDLPQFNDEVLKYIFTYGLKQILNDAGSSGKDADQKLAMAQKKLATMYAGELRKARETDGRTAVEVEMAKLARDEVVKAMRAAGRKVKEVTEVWLEQVTERHLEKHGDRLRKAAEAIIAARQAARAEAITVEFDFDADPTEGDESEDIQGDDADDESEDETE